MNPYQVVKDFERAVCEYTGAPYCVALNSCTSALLLAVAWQLRNGVAGFQPARIRPTAEGGGAEPGSPWVYERVCPLIEIPKRTYVSVPMSIIHAGGRPTFRDEEWSGWYQLKPLPVFDSARYFSSLMYQDGSMNCKHPMICVSFQAAKTLGDTQGGAILLDDPVADAWLRRARFDGRTERIPPNMDKFDMVGWHCYMSADVAARLLLKLYSLPKNNAPLSNDAYPDLSEMEIFK